MDIKNVKIYIDTGDIYYLYDNQLLNEQALCDLNSFSVKKGNKITSKNIKKDVHNVHLFSYQYNFKKFS